MTRSPARGKLIAMAIAIVGIGAALLGVYVLKTQRPVAGTVIRTVTLPDGVITLRAEQGGARHFIEYRDARLSWQALIPPYAGADGSEALSYDDRVIMVRVLRSGQEAIFSFARNETSRLGTITLGPTTPVLQAAVAQLGGRVWTAPPLAYHLVADGAAGIAIGAFDLRNGKPRWKSPVALTASASAPMASALGLWWQDAAGAHVLRADQGQAASRKGGLRCAQPSFAVLALGPEAFELWDGTWENARG